VPPNGRGLAEARSIHNPCLFISLRYQLVLRRHRRQRARRLAVRADERNRPLPSQHGQVSGGCWDRYSAPPPALGLKSVVHPYRRALDSQRVAPDNPGVAPSEIWR